MRAADFIFDYLAKIGVSHVFTLTGGGSIFLLDALGKNKQIQTVFNLHEQAAGIAAEAYAQYKNDLGVCLTTSGPGATNAITACAAAWCDSTPVLFISGQVKTSDLKPLGLRQKGFQEIDIVNIVSPITKFSARVLNACDLRYMLSKAALLAITDRKGPVWLDIPLDVQAATIDFDQYGGYSLYSGYSEAGGNAVHAESERDKVRELIKSSKRPIFLAGNGIRLGDCVENFMDLVEYGFPFMTTWKTIDFADEDHPNYVGRPGTIGQFGANSIIQEADLLISIGARLDYGQTGFNQKSFAKNAKKIVVDIDPEELQKYNFEVDYKMNVSAWSFIISILGFEFTPNKEWLSFCKKLYLETRDCQQADVYKIISKISDMAPSRAVIVPGSSGMASEVTCQIWKTKYGQRFLNNQGLGSMGFGISAAIGACLASGRKPTICIEGDGSFAMNIQELETIKRLYLPITIFVLNNGGYRSIRYTQENHFNGHYFGSNEESGLTLPSIQNQAIAYDIPYWNFKELANLKTLSTFNGPNIVECFIDEKTVAYPRLISKKLEDGTMVSPDFADLSLGEDLRR